MADRNDAASLRKALGSIRFDTVYDFAYDWEHGTTGAPVEATAQIFDGKVARYVFMSSVAAYGDGPESPRRRRPRAGRPPKPILPEQGDERAGAVPTPAREPVSRL